MSGLSDVWALRNLGRISESYEGFLAWGARFPGAKALPTPEKLDLLLSSGVSLEEAADYCLLEVSFLRNQLHFPEAREALGALEVRLSREPLPNRFQLLFQKALNAFADGDFTSAFELFIEARSLAPGDVEMAGVLYNQILVMEELGMEVVQVWQAFRALVPRLSSVWRDFFERKAHAVRLRIGFRAGEIAELVKPVSASTLDEYSHYFLAWCGELPHLDIPGGDAISRELAGDYAATGPQWLSGYRLRTLRGLLLDADLGPKLPLREAVERFYLWTWRWLTDPTAEGLARVLEFRKRLAPERHHVLSPDHRQMLENALRWLALFAFLPDVEIQRSARLFKGSSGPVSCLLDYEKFLLDYWLGVRSSRSTIARDTYDFLTLHRAHGLEGFLLPGLLQAVVSGGKASSRLFLLNHSLGCLFPRETEKLETGILVNAMERKVRVIQKGRSVEEIPHAALVSLCLLLQEKTAFSKTEILRYCYGLPRYDAYLHDNKIANLLSQANRVFAGAVRFAVKGDAVSAQWLAPDRVRFEGGCRHSSLLAGVAANPGILLGDAPAEAPEPAPPAVDWDLLDEDWMARSHVEKLMGVSKATATRRLNEWIEKGLVEFRGKGRGSRYRMTPEFHERLRREGTHR